MHTLPFSEICVHECPLLNKDIGILHINTVLATLKLNCKFSNTILQWFEHLNDIMIYGYFSIFISLCVYLRKVFCNLIIVILKS